MPHDETPHSFVGLTPHTRSGPFGARPSATSAVLVRSCQAAPLHSKIASSSSTAQTSVADVPNTLEYPPLNRSGVSAQNPSAVHDAQ
jgi:hypothetical protein